MPNDRQENEQDRVYEYGCTRIIRNARRTQKESQRREPVTTASGARRTQKENQRREPVTTPKPEPTPGSGKPARASGKTTAERNTTDWRRIKTEYINSDVSQRKLADKYGITYRALRCRAERENWLEQRKTQRRKTDAKAAQKTIERAATQQADYAELLQSTAYQLVQRIEQKIAKNSLTAQDIQRYAQSIKHLTRPNDPTGGSLTVMFADSDIEEAAET